MKNLFSFPNFCLVLLCVYSDYLYIKFTLTQSAVPGLCRCLTVAQIPMLFLLQSTVLNSQKILNFSFESCSSFGKSLRNNVLPCTTKNKKEKTKKTHQVRRAYTNITAIKHQDYDMYCYLSQTISKKKKVDKKDSR